jgi:hypothetical protein
LRGADDFFVSGVFSFICVMIIVLCAWALAAFAQLEPRGPQVYGDKLLGTWHTYQTFREGTHVVFRGTIAYMLTPSGLLIYDANTGEERRFGRVQGFPAGVSTGLFYDAASDYLFVTFSDGLIVYFRRPEEMMYIRDVVVSENVINKKINYAEGDGRFVYFSADFGIMAYDLSRREARFSYFKIGDAAAFTPVLRHGFFAGRLYAHLTTGGLYSADLAHPNLADGAAWRKDFDKVKNFCVSPHGVYVHADTAVYFFDGSPWRVVDVLPRVSAPFRTFRPTPDGRVVYIPVYPDSSNNRVAVVGDKLNKVVWDVKDFALSADGRYCAVADAHLGLNVYVGFMGWNLFQSHLPFSHPDNDEPPSNAVGRVAVGPGELYIAPGADYSDDGFFRLDLRTGQWTFFPADTVGTVEMKNYNRAYFLDGKAYVSAYLRGVKEIERGGVKNVWTYENSCLGRTGDQPPHTVGMVKDKAGYLWALISNSNRPLIKIGPDGSCQEFQLPEISYETNLFDLAIDEADNKWVVARRSIYVFNDPMRVNAADGFRRLQQSEGRGGLPGGSSLCCVTLDKDGHMWIGSTSGVSVYYVAASALRAAYDAVCPVFNFRCLLETETVNDIFVDGANRKWIATNASGIFVFDADGTRQIAHYTSRNAPLPSDRVVDIEGEPQTGEIFIVTDGGLVSFRANAAEGADSNREIYVYPNPVRADYDGPINVYPSTAGAVVKILTPTGYLVREIQSEGGRTVWDGRDVAGQKIQPGVYIVLVSTDDGKNPGRTQFAVLGN